MAKYGHRSLFSHPERSLQDCSVHCCHNLQVLPWVWIDFFMIVKTHAATAVSGLAFDVIAAVTVLGDVVVVIATSAACVPFVVESGGIVEQKEAATGLHVLFH